MLRSQRACAIADLATFRTLERTVCWPQCGATHGLKNHWNKGVETWKFVFGSAFWKLWSVVGLKLAVPRSREVREISKVRNPLSKLLKYFAWLHKRDVAPAVVRVHIFEKHSSSWRENHVTSPAIRYSRVRRKFRLYFLESERVMAKLWSILGIKPFFSQNFTF